MADPYRTLGVKSSATSEQIRAAYRKLALKYHPDRRPGDKDAERKFKEISAAYDLLSDVRSRARFDDARRRPASRPGAAKAHQKTSGGVPGGLEALQAWLQAVKTALVRGEKPPPPPQGWEHVSIQVAVPAGMRGARFSPVGGFGPMPTFGAFPYGSVPVVNMWMKGRKRV